MNLFVKRSPESGIDGKILSPDRNGKGSAVLLDDEHERTPQRRKRSRKAAGGSWRTSTAWKIISPIIVACISLVLTFFLVKFAINKVKDSYFMPVDPNDATPIVVEIPTGSGASAIAKLLYEACGEDQPGLITHKAIFKIYVDFIGKSNRLQAGTYVLSKNMSVPEIVDVICKGNPPRPTITFTVPEGLTLEAMADKLKELGVIDDTEYFLSLCITGEKFVKDHPFIAEIPVDESGERKYVLEGFLFPDTYDIYADATVETVIDKMLTRFDLIFGAVYTARARELNMTFYEVVTLASILEKEAKTFDFAKVSAVFYNRIDGNMNLESDATLEYVLKTGSLHLTQEQLDTPSLYNTHLNSGLPIGPISNPGDKALNAALYPDEKFIEDKYLYFCLMEPESGALAFARTLSEHNKNIALYSPNW